MSEAKISLLTFSLTAKEIRKMFWEAMIEPLETFLIISSDFRIEVRA